MLCSMFAWHLSLGLGALATSYAESDAADRHAVIGHNADYEQVPIGQHDWTEQLSTPKNIAIIGAGAGGSSAAYHLRKFAEEKSLQVNITVFEQNSYIGGRSTTVNAYDDASQPVELGASVFVEVNRILVSAVKDLNLTVSSGHDRLEMDASADRSREEIGIWNGLDFVWRQSVSGKSSWETYYDYARLFWRYGFAPKRALDLVSEVIGRFLNMYDSPHFPFESITETAHALNLHTVTAATGAEYLEANRIGRLFANELIQSATRVNYAQNLAQIHGLDTLVSLAAENAMSVDGGNWRIFDEMLKSSKARVLLNTKIETITRGSDDRFQLKHQLSVPSIEEHGFDEVILAAPFHQTGVAVEPPLAHTPDDVPYVKLHVTLFASKTPISGVYFKQETVPEVILTTLPPVAAAASAGKVPFNSISLLRRPVNPHTGVREYLYKIFSLERFPTHEDLSNLLQADPNVVVTWIHRKDWLAYPHAFPRVTFEQIKLAKGIWYTSAIDNFISTMETNSLAGKNIAKLMVDSWN